MKFLVYFKNEFLILLAIVFLQIVMCNAKTIDFCKDSKPQISCPDIINDALVQPVNYCRNAPRNFFDFDEDQKVAIVDAINSLRNKIANGSLLLRSRSSTFLFTPPASSMTMLVSF